MLPASFLPRPLFEHGTAEGLPPLTLSAVLRVPENQRGAVRLTCKRVAARADTAVVTLVSDGLRLNMSTRCNMSTNIDNRVCHRSACISTCHKSERLHGV
jgi:hypothetical protein